MKNQERINEITSAVGAYPTDNIDNPGAQSYTYAGPAAEVIAQLERRIEILERESASVRGRLDELEQRPVPDAKVELGAMSVDTRAGLSVSDVVELSRALRGNDS